MEYIDQHDPIADCDCHDCAIAERNRLQGEMVGKQAQGRVIAEQQKEIGPCANLGWKPEARP